MVERSHTCAAMPDHAALMNTCGGHPTHMLHVIMLKR